jgi:septum formation inhibitor MinC
VQSNQAFMKAGRARQACWGGQAVGQVGQGTHVGRQGRACSSACRQSIVSSQAGQGCRQAGWLGVAGRQAGWAEKAGRHSFQDKQAEQSRQTGRTQRAGIQFRAGRHAGSQGIPRRLAWHYRQAGWGTAGRQGRASRQAVQSRQPVRSGQSRKALQSRKA